MNFYEIIISLAILIGIVLYKKTKPLSLRIILVGLITCLLLSFFDSKVLINTSFFGFGILALVYFVFALEGNNWLAMVITLFTLLKFLWNIFYWPFIGELQALMIIPLFCFGLVLYRWRDHQNYLSLVIIFSAIILIEVFTLIEGWV